MFQWLPLRRRLLYISVPEFPVAVERVANPSLRSRPAAVATSLSGDERLIVCSHEASRASLFPSLPVAQAVRRSPGLVVLPYNGLKHLGLWLVKRKPSPRANAPPLHIHLDY